MSEELISLFAPLKDVFLVKRRKAEEGRKRDEKKEKKIKGGKREGRIMTKTTTAHYGLEQTRKEM